MTVDPDVAIEAGIAMVGLGRGVEAGSEEGRVVRRATAGGLTAGLRLQVFMFVRICPHVSQLDNS